MDSICKENVGISSFQSSQTAHSQAHNNRSAGVSLGRLTERCKTPSLMVNDNFQIINQIGLCENHNSGWCILTSARERKMEIPATILGPTLVVSYALTFYTSNPPHRPALRRLFVGE